MGKPGRGGMPGRQRAARIGEPGAGLWTGGAEWSSDPALRSGGHDPAPRTAEGRAMRVTMVAVLYNSGDSLDTFLACLRAQDMADWRLVAVDNASRDDSAARLETFADPRARLIRNARNVGFARAANQGLREAAADAAADCFILINTDTQFAPDFLRRFREVWTRLGSDVMAPRIMSLSEPDRAWYAGGHFSRDWVMKNFHDEYDPTDTAEMREVEFASGCCLGLSRRTLETVGLLDESFFVYWEDADYCLRLAAHGIPIHYVSEPALHHWGGASSGGEFSPAYLRLYCRSHMVLLKKHQGLLQAVRDFARILVLEAGRRTIRLSKLRIMAGAMLRGLLTPLRPEPRL